MYGDTVEDKKKKGASKGARKNEKISSTQNGVRVTEDALMKQITLEEMFNTRSLKYHGKKISQERETKHELDRLLESHNLSLKMPTPRRREKPAASPEAEP